MIKRLRCRCKYEYQSLASINFESAEILATIELCGRDPFRQRLQDLQG